MDTSLRRKAAVVASYTAMYRYMPGIFPAKPANPAIKAGGIRFPVLSELASHRFTRLNGGYSERFANRPAALEPSDDDRALPLL